MSGKPVKQLSLLQLRNELGPAAPDPRVDYNMVLRLSTMKRQRAGTCMDFLPAKVENSNKRKCFVCNGQTQLNCAGGRCGI